VDETVEATSLIAAGVEGVFVVGEASVMAGDESVEAGSNITEKVLPFSSTLTC
jgi:hypothetical protein